MNELQIKEKLESALHTEIGLAEWQDLKDAELLDEYQRDKLSWSDLREVVDETLCRLRRFLSNVNRERTGELKRTGELESGAEETPELPDIPPTTLDDRTFARGQALSSLNQLRTGGTSSGRPSIYGTLFPRGGADGTLGQWVSVVAAELWVPAEEVMRGYRSMQRTMLADPKPPKTSTRAFEVAAFVWQNELEHGKRPPMPVLCERWNNWPLTVPFKDWRSFHRSFKRGANATPPRYKMTNQRIADEVRSHSGQGPFDDWASKVRA
jgi:hypothetical protein